MRAAIVGAGFCGLALAYSLSEFMQVSLIEANPIAKNASGIAAGLLHAYPGMQAKRAKNGGEGMRETLLLTKAASQALNQDIALKTGLLRIAVSEQQRKDFYKTHQQYPQETVWMEQKECENLCQISAPALYVPEAYTVKTEDYLKGLWKICESRGVHWIQKRINAIEELNDFDLRIIATGAGTHSLNELAQLPLECIKGQILEIEKPESVPLSPIPIASKGYLIPCKEKNTLLLGATFERGFSDDLPDTEAAKILLKPNFDALFPNCNAFNVLGCRAGVRMSAPGHQPLRLKWSDNTWILTGMGSKGLLYHALYAKKLVSEIKEAL